MEGKVRLNKEQRGRLIRICVCLAVFAVIFIIDKTLSLEVEAWGANSWFLPFALYLVVYIAIGYDVLWRAVVNISHGQIFDENFLMCIATLGAFSLAIYRGVTGLTIEGFDEACAVLLFYQVGEFFQDYATEKSRHSIAGLMDIRPDYANVIRESKEIKVSPEDVAVGEIIVVNAGERVPLDGVIISGSSSIETKALTGESLPRDVVEGDEILSGSVNLTSRIEISVSKEFYDSTVAKILDLVENAAEQKSRAENFITKFARYYTPIVVIAALALAIIPGAITSDWSDWVYRALNFLVVSCPCALVISIPMSFFAGLGAASKCNILIKGSNYLEKLNTANVFAFDKTGTITKGNFVVAKVHPEERREEILHIAAIAERGSAHPIAKSILACYGKEPESDYVQSAIAGTGMKATKGTDEILVGNEKLMSENGIDFVLETEVGTVVYVALNGELIGSLLIVDEIKSESPQVIQGLNAIGCKTIMLTGDNEQVASVVASEVGVSSFRASLMPGDKVGVVEELIATNDKKKAVCFVGDGINDAPVLMRSDIGISMGGVGSDAAIEASDIVLMQDDLRSISTAKRIAKKTMAVVLENIMFSLVVKIAILILSALGTVNMWVAVFGDVGVAVIAILNAMRVNTGRARDNYTRMR